MKAAIYKCSFCKFEDRIALRDLRKCYDFKEDDLATYPRLECDCCHKTENYPSKVKDLPDEWFPEVTDWDAFLNS